MGGWVGGWEGGRVGGWVGGGFYSFFVKRSPRTTMEK